MDQPGPPGKTARSCFCLLSGSVCGHALIDVAAGLVLQDAAVVYYSVFMWHLKNPTQVLGGVIPEYEEKGPYVYR